MSEEMKTIIEETVADLKQLGEQSLRIVQSNTAILKARDALDKQSEQEE